MERVCEVEVMKRQLVAGVLPVPLDRCTGFEVSDSESVVPHGFNEESRLSVGDVAERRREKPIRNFGRLESKPRSDVEVEECDRRSVDLR